MAKRKKIKTFMFTSAEDFKTAISDAISNYSIQAYDIDASRREIAGAVVFFIEIWKK